MRKGQIEIKFLRTLTANSYSFENTTTEGVSAGYQYINSPPIGGEAGKAKREMLNVSQQFFGGNAHCLSLISITLGATSNLTRNKTKRINQSTSNAKAKP